jgi:RNA polymerase sigma-70 factor (ECF subfamily)
MPHRAQPWPPAALPGENDGKKYLPSGVQDPEHGMVMDLDQDVIESCREGDADAFRQLFERHKDKVYSIALRFSGDHAAAMDIAQDTFLKLMDRIGQFRGDASFDSWLYRLVVNRCMDYRRRQQRWMPIVEDFFDSFRAPEPSAMENLLRNEMEQQVQDAVAKLAPEYRIVVILRYTEGMSYEEIADLLQVSRGTVASRLNRAHGVLERRLAKLARERK